MMARRFSCCVLGCAVALAAAVVCGVVAESRWGIAKRAAGIAGRAAERDASLCEMKLISEFAATKSFGDASEFMLRDLAADGLPLARAFRTKLDTTTLDANDTETAVAKMLVGIAGDPKSNKDTFMLQTVFQCTMFGVEYGRFTARRSGVTEDNAVDGMVTAYASSALDGLIAFLAELPQPEAQPTPQPAETPPPPQPAETPPQPPQPTPQPEAPSQPQPEMP